MQEQCFSSVLVQKYTFDYQYHFTVVGLLKYFSVLSLLTKYQTYMGM